MLTAENIQLYYGASHILRGVSVSAELGKISCVLGRNGVGKTSLMRALMGLQGIRSGKLEFDGQDIAAMKPADRARKGIALVPQGREIFPRLTVLENLQTGYAAVSRADRYIPDEIFDLFPVLADMKNRRGGDLSGGQQQQLAIGRALVMRPKLLILDEPTEGIQPSIIKDIGRVLRMLADRGTMAILLVEQYLDFARELGDTLAIMERGQIILSGKRDEFSEQELRAKLAV
ncbi:urea ABC transporter ATP-binding subunit UrtE [Lacibacterium aquatile]|uniref:Urea ABC transporter ATP-binding subunit UrtE n=1 Tax=Lacibacterium aquatile TaxID=1168082 RepID=A0ABW5DN84_9PROT